MFLTTGPEPVFDDDTGMFIKFKLLDVGQGDAIVRFDVGDDAPDPSRVPAKLRANPAMAD